MLFDLEVLSAQDRYKILTATVTPRPIAWITTLSAAGLINAAPYSFFNVMGHEPPTVAVGLLSGGGHLKDTAANIIETGEFVVNLVGEDNAMAMNITAIDAPGDIDELTLAGLAAARSLVVKPPRIEAAPVAFECRSLTTIETGPQQVVVIGQVVRAYIEDKFVLDPTRCHIDTPALRLVARMHGSGWYARSTDLFQMQRPRWQDVAPRKERPVEA